MTLVMFGLDGADPDLVERWIEDLPNFQRLKEEGFFGELQSTMPPITVPAWACMLSSRTPDYFEVTHFQKMDPERYERELVLSDAFRPEIMTDSDFKTISYLIPGTTPAYDTNGVMVSGYLTGDELQFRPRDLEEPMKAETDIEIEKAKAERKKNAVSSFENSFDGFDWLIRNKDFDVALSAFQMIDFAFHDKASEDIKEEYEAADRKLGELMSLCDQQGWDLLVTSDHGSAESTRKLYINAWLRDKGYLKYEESQESAGNKIKYKFGDLLMEAGLKKVAKAGIKVYKKILGSDPTPSGDNKENIDFSETKAFSDFASGMNATGIYVHDNRFTQGIVENRKKVAQEIMEELEEEEFIQQVYYDEERLEKDRMPDLIVESEPSVGIGSAFYPQIFHNTDAAIHNKKGLIGGIGDSFVEGRHIRADILDVKPTIEATLGKVSLGNQGEVIDRVLTDHVSYEKSIDLDDLEV